MTVGPPLLFLPQRVASLGLLLTPHLYVLPHRKPLGSVVSEHGLRSVKLRVKYTDLFLTTVTFRVPLKDFHHNWLGSDCCYYVPPQGSTMSLSSYFYTTCVVGKISSGCVSLEHFTN